MQQTSATWLDPLGGDGVHGDWRAMYIFIYIKWVASIKCHASMLATSNPHNTSPHNELSRVKTQGAIQVQHVCWSNLWTWELTSSSNIYGDNLLTPLEPWWFNAHFLITKQTSWNDLWNQTLLGASAKPAWASEFLVAKCSARPNLKLSQPPASLDHEVVLGKTKRSQWTCSKWSILRCPGR